MSEPLWRFEPKRQSTVAPARIATLLHQLMAAPASTSILVDLTHTERAPNEETKARARRLGGHLATIIDGYELPACVLLHPGAIQILWLQHFAPDFTSLNTFSTLTLRWLRRDGLLIPEHPFAPWQLTDDHTESVIEALAASFRALAAELRA